MHILNYTPGARATVFLEITDGYLNVRVDAVGVPIISSILLPDFTNDGYDGYHLPMTQLDVGLYAFQFLIPSGAISVGSYFISASYVHPYHNAPSSESWQLIVSAPFGQYNATVITS